MGIFAFGVLQFCATCGQLLAQLQRLPTDFPERNRTIIMNEKGYLALVLHAHLPFVRHPEYDDFLEEDWFFEALTETYLPLLEVMDGLERDGADWRLTMSVTPTL